jgi:DNA-binding transcriptional ArsR family regulator
VPRAVESRSGGSAAFLYAARSLFTAFEKSAILYRVVNNLNAVYSALADPTRRQMVERLREGDLTVSQLAEPLTMTLAAVGKHIAVLESAHIISTTKRGRVRTCAIVPRSLTDATAWLTEQERFWNERLDALVTYLEDQ